MSDNTYDITKVVGTSGYLDPYQTSRGLLSLHCDIFAFGVVMLELLTGMKAHDKLRDKHMLYEIISVFKASQERPVVEEAYNLFRGPNEFPKPDERNPVFEKLLNIAIKCIEPRPKDRPNAAKCVEDLLALIEED
jgi:serine/threonine protein kinase